MTRQTKASASNVIRSKASGTGARFQHHKVKMAAVIDEARSMHCTLPTNQEEPPSSVRSKKTKKKKKARCFVIFLNIVLEKKDTVRIGIGTTYRVRVFVC